MAEISNVPLVVACDLTLNEAARIDWRLTPPALADYDFDLQGVDTAGARILAMSSASGSIAISASGSSWTVTLYKPLVEMRRLRAAVGSYRLRAIHRASGQIYPLVSGPLTIMAAIAAGEV